MSATTGWMIYGANGYTGELIARLAHAKGWPASRLILAGRNDGALSPLAAGLGYQQRVFSLADPAAIDGALTGIKVVLNCAGPFVHTAAPLVDGCLRARAHYLDITGEVAVFQALGARDAEARAAGVMLLPGAGFDVVPSDCLAAHLAARLPGATHLQLAFQAGEMSRGTALTAIEGIGQGGLIRRDGKLTPVRAGHLTMKVDLGDGPRTVVAIPWGDVVTAYVTTGIPNIEVYIAAPTLTRVSLYATRYLKGILTAQPVQRFLQARVRANTTGPDEAQRTTGKCLLWGQASDGAGRVVVSRLRGPEPYQLTAMTALDLADRALTGNAPAGYQTPARAYGKDVILDFAGVTRQDE